MQQIKKIISGLFVFIFVFPVLAQVQTPADTDTAIAMDAVAQSTGEFDQVDLSYIHTLGM